MLRRALRAAVLQVRRDPLQVEEGEAEGWCQERCLKVDRDQHREPVDHRGLRHVIAEVHVDDHAGEDRQNDQGDLQPIEEEAEQKGC